MEGDRKSVKEMLAARKIAHEAFISEGQAAMERMRKGQEEQLKLEKLRNHLLRLRKKA
jgi:hypothetical protein